MNFRESLFFLTQFSPRWKEYSSWTFLFVLIKAVSFHAIPITIMLIIDSYIPAKDTNGIRNTLFIALGLALICFLFHTIYNAYAQSYFIRTGIGNMQLAMARKIQIAKQVNFDEISSGVAFSRLAGSVMNVQNGLFQLYGTVLDSAIVLTFSVSVLIIVQWKLAILLLLLVPLVVFLTVVFRKRLIEHQNKVRNENENLSNALVIFIQNTLLARVHGEENFENKKIEHHSMNVYSATRSLLANNAKFNALTWSLNQLFVLATASAAAIFVMRGELLLGELILFIQYVSKVTGAAINILNQTSTFLQMNEHAGCIKEILEIPTEKTYGGVIVKERPEGGVTVKNLTFTYPGKNEPALKNLNVEIKPGETIGIAGSSGSGKSTFVKLLCGLYEPDSGEICVDNFSLGKIDKVSLRQYYGIVPQDPVLFTGSISDNIAHGLTNKSENQIRDAAMRAGAWPFIEKLPGGLDSRVEENGNNFSGGERQRISIARAILRTPSFLILDEATSALDSESEFFVQQSIKNLLGKQTTFLVAHRLSTLRDADRILVFDKGEIIESGNHFQLIEQKGVYASLVTTQAGSESDSEGER